METVVLNHIRILKEKNYNVFVIGKFGKYTEKYEAYGAKCIDFEFLLRKHYKNEDIQIINKVIIENNITEIHIHSSECIPYVFTYCVIHNIPYVAYIHGGFKEVYVWYINNYYIFNYYFPLYFENAYRNIAITKKAKENIINLFNISNKKDFLICPNSLDFDNIPESYIENDKNKVLILSRLSIEKETSIINGIEFFIKYKEKMPNASLSILGTGNAENEIKKFIEKNNLSEVTNFLGESNDIYEEIKKYDIVIGMGRCVLEAISMKKIAIVSGYKNITDIVTKDNIEKIAEENFTDRYCDSNNMDLVLEKLIKIKPEEILNIINENYKICFEKYNYRNNFFCIDDVKKINYALDFEKISETFNNTIDYYDNKICFINAQAENSNIKKFLEKTTKDFIMLKEENNKIYERYCKMKAELDQIYNSRLYKYFYKNLKRKKNLS